MNILGFVLSILSILSIGALVSLEKQTSAHRLRASYLGHLHANRDILGQSASAFYESLRYIPTPAEREEKKQEQERGLPPPPLINPECSRINLSLLIEQDGGKEKALYELTAKMLKAFYGKCLFGKETRFEYHFLDALLEAIRDKLMEEEPFALEKLDFRDSVLQPIYYRMLKGTKNGTPYPSLLEYVKVEPIPGKICLFHADPCMLAALFSDQAAIALYKAFHMPKAPPSSREAIERICLQTHVSLFDPHLFDLLDLHCARQRNGSRITLVGEDFDTQIVLKKTIVLKTR